MSHLDGVLSKLVQLKSITDGSMEAELPAAGDHRALSVKPPADFYDFSAKSSYFSATWISFRTFFELFERSKLLKFGSHLKELNCPPIHFPPITNTLSSKHV